jgi:hypothetical protein
VRKIALFTMLGCGAPIYFPVEPPPFAPDSASDTGDTAGPVVTDTGTPPTPGTTTTPPTLGGLPCSSYGGFDSELTIRNHGPTALSLYWRDFICIEYFYGTVEPYDDFEQGTYENHGWVLRDSYGVPVSSMVIKEEEVLWEVP